MPCNTNTCESVSERDPTVNTSPAGVARYWNAVQTILAA